MAQPALATSTDVATALGRALTPEETTRVGGMLTKASDLFRKHAKQLFTEGDSHVRLKVNGGEVRLPQSPVREVESVTDDEGSPVGFTLFGQVLTVRLASHRFVRVKYTHGASEPPELVRKTVAEVVARVLDIAPQAKAGMSQYSKGTGPFTESGTFASWAVGGQVMLSPSDIAIAESYRPRRGNGTVVMRA